MAEQGQELKTLAEKFIAKETKKTEQIRRSVETRKAADKLKREKPTQ